MNARYTVLCVMLFLSASCPVFAATDTLLTRLTQVSPSWERQRALEELTALDLPAKTHLLSELRLALKDNNPYVRQNAAEALGTLDQFGTPAKGDLQQLRKDPVGDVRQHAAISLARIGDEDKPLIEGLVNQLQTQPEVKGNAYYEAGAKVARYGAANALGFIGSGAKHADITIAIPALSKALLNDPDVDVRNKAAWALGAIGEKAHASIPALTAATHDPKVSYMAAWAIKQIQQQNIR